MLGNAIELDPLVIPPDTLAFNVVEVGYPAVRGFDHVGEDA